MLRKAFVGVLMVVLAFSAPAFAELENVELGGSIEVYAAYYTEFFESTPTARIPASWLPLRPIGPGGTVSAVRADDNDHGMAFVEQRTRLNFKADFAERVTAFIELDSIDAVWGEDFRSNYVTGGDMRAASVDDVEVYQAYIEADAMCGAPVRLRVGRQEIAFGSGWLVGANPDADPFTGLSFDAVRLTYSGAAYTVDAWWSKLAEMSPIEEDGDIDFYGIYATCTAIEDIEFDAYWMCVRDAVSVQNTRVGLIEEWLEDALGLDDYDVTELHTVGLRSAGARGAWDWEVEGAYQCGEADAVGWLFVPVGRIFGDDGASFDNWAGHCEVGYTFDAAWQPRAYLGAQYYEGEDRRDLSFWEWLNPFDRPEASVSFNRLFSDHEVDCFLCGSALTNFWGLSAGVSGTPTEKLELSFALTYQEVVEAFDWPVYVSVGRWRLPVAPFLSFWTTEDDDDLGWQATLTVSYDYTEDLNFEVGWTHFFVGEGLEDGAFIDNNALTFIGGRDDEDADLVYFLAAIAF